MAMRMLKCLFFRAIRMALMAPLLYYAGKAVFGPDSEEKLNWYGQWFADQM
jgi:hypothetical protein